MLTLVTRSLEADRLDELACRLIESHPELVTVAQNVNPVSLRAASAVRHVSLRAASA